PVAVELLGGGGLRFAARRRGIRVGLEAPGGLAGNRFDFERRRPRGPHSRQAEIPPATHVQSGTVEHPDQSHSRSARPVHGRQGRKRVVILLEYLEGPPIWRGAEAALSVGAGWFTKPDFSRRRDAAGCRTPGPISHPSGKRGEFVAGDQRNG